MAPPSLPPDPPSAPVGGVAARRRLVQRIAVLALWLVVFLAWRRYQTSNGLSTADAAQRFVDAADAAWWGALAYVGVYLVRPLVLFPASILTVVAGVLFGPFVGVAVVVVAANASAMIAFWIGRAIGRAPDARTPTSLLAGWIDRLRTNSFETILVMRLLYLPYDLVNYGAGALHVRALPFLLATAIGSLPGTVSFVLLGASLERVDRGIDGIDGWALVAGLAILVVSLTMARVLDRHRRTETQ